MRVRTSDIESYMRRQGAGVVYVITRVTDQSLWRLRNEE